MLSPTSHPRPRVDDKVLRGGAEQTINSEGVAHPRPRLYAHPASPHGSPRWCPTP